MDRVTWFFYRNELFIVKSTYKVAKEMTEHEQGGSKVGQYGEPNDL